MLGSGLVPIICPLTSSNSLLSANRNLKIPFFYTIFFFKWLPHLYTPMNEYQRYQVASNVILEY